MKGRDPQGPQGCRDLGKPMVQDSSYLQGRVVKNLPSAI